MSNSAVGLHVMNSESKIAQNVAKATRLLNDVSEDWNHWMLQEANGMQTHR